MSEFRATTPACYKVVCRGRTETFDHPVSIVDMKKVAREQSLVTFHAYDLVSGRELDEGRDFPYSGDMELRTYAAPKSA